MRLGMMLQRAVGLLDRDLIGRRAARGDFGLGLAVGDHALHRPVAVRPADADAASSVRAPAVNSAPALGHPFVEIGLQPVVRAADGRVGPLGRVLHHLVAGGLRDAPGRLQPLHGQIGGLVGIDAIGPQRGIGGR
jgi:hypothetical protein